jgi:hypothetical protein
MKWKNLSQDNRCLYTYLNPGPPEYEAGVFSHWMTMMAAVRTTYTTIYCAISQKAACHLQLLFYSTALTSLSL